MTITNQSAAVRHLAGVCGWKVTSDFGRLFARRGKIEHCELMVEWNPAVSRDHCAEVEARLIGKQWPRYIDALLKIGQPGIDLYEHSRFLLTAPPSVRFPALCEATGYREDR